MSKPDDPVYRHARREAAIILASWAVATIYCCGFCYVFGYIRPGAPRSEAEIDPILGMPSWFFWGVAVPWVVAMLFTIGFAAFGVADDDLGEERIESIDDELAGRGD